MEDSFGEKLFRRQGRANVLTDAGQIALRYADEIFALGEELSNAIERRPSAKANRLAQAFAKFDREAAIEIAAVHKDETAFATQVRRSITEIEDQFEEDRLSIAPSVDDAWDNTQLRKTGSGRDFLIFWAQAAHRDDVTHFQQIII